MTTRHTSAMPAMETGGSVESSSESPENPIVEPQWPELGNEDKKYAVAGDMKDLELKLRELEEEKSAIDLRRSRVEVDIATLQRAMQLIGTRNATKDVALDLAQA